MNYDLIGKRIRRLRTEHGFTQTEFAKMLSCSRKHLGNIERGESRPSLECLHDISNALNVTLDYLVSENIPTKSYDEHSELVLNVDHFLEEKQQEFQQMRLIIQQFLKEKL